MLTIEKVVKYAEILDRELWATNKLVGDIWVLPNREECLEFAYCEGAEVLDAMIRMNPKFMRNNAKDTDMHDVYCEALDCVMMIWKSWMADNMTAEVINDFKSSSGADIEYVRDILNSWENEKLRLRHAVWVNGTHASFYIDVSRPIDTTTLLMWLYLIDQYDESFLEFALVAKMQRTIQKAEMIRQNKIRDELIKDNKNGLDETEK